MSRSAAELARLAQQHGFSLGQLCADLEAGGERAREAWELERDEAALLMELPPGPDVDAALQLLAKYPHAVVGDLMALNARQLDVLASVPRSLVPGKAPRSEPYQARGRASDLARMRVAPPTKIRALQEDYDAESETRRLAEVGAAALAPQHVRNRLQVHKEPRLIALRNGEKERHRAAVVARKRTHAYPSGGWVQYGISPRDVDDWFRRALFDADETVREIAARMGRHPWFVARALTYLLWHLQLPTARAPGEERPRKYLGVVAGFARGQLAKLIPCRHHDGTPYVPRTITRAIAVLKQRLEGVLEVNQPSPISAEEHGLPGAWHVLDNGSRLRQADNVYWWRRVGAAAASVSPAASPVVDRRSTCCGDQNNSHQLATDRDQQPEAATPPKESPAATSSGARRAPPSARLQEPQPAVARAEPVKKQLRGGGGFS